MFLKLCASALALFVINARAAESNSVRLAVVPFFAPPGNSDLQQIASRAPDLLMVELSHDNRFQLVEREKINAVWSELHLAEAGLTSADTVGKLGRILSCDWLVSGSFVQTEISIQVWIKVIDTQNSVVLDLKAVPYNPANFSETVSNVAAFLTQVGSHSTPHQFVSLENFVDTSASSAHADWSQQLSALIEKDFLAAGFGVVEREAMSPIFSEYQLQTAGLTGDSTNRVKLKPAFWIVDGTCKWVYDTQDKLSVELRIRKAGGGEQILRFTKLPGDELEKAVVESIQSALTNTSPMTLEQAEAGEANIRTAHIQELTKFRGELPMSTRYDTNTTFITVTDAYGGTRQLTVDPEWQARLGNHKRDMFNTLEQAILLNPNDMRSKWSLGRALYKSDDAVDSKHGEDLLEEVAASGDAIYATRAKNWLEDFRTGRLSFTHDQFGNIQIVIHGQPASIPAYTNLRPTNNWAAQRAKPDETQMLR
jgi:curli biogenesis system outer membrane secretion channel CsgG